MSDLERLRVAVHSGDEELFGPALLQCLQSMSAGEENPILLVCPAPFDQEWFAALPVNIRLYAVNEMVKRAVARLEPAGYLRRLLAASFGSEELPIPARESFACLYCVLLLLAGELDPVRAVSEKTAGELRLPGIRGWIAYLEGDAERAIPLFVADLEKLQELNESRDAYFTGPEGIFFILALLKENAFDSAGRIKGLIRSVSRLQPHSVYLPAYEVLAMVADALTGQAQEYFQRRTATPWSVDLHSLIFLVRELVNWWLEGETGRQSGLDAALLAARAREGGWHYLAREFALLARRAGVVCGIAEGLPTGLATMSDALVFEEPWRRALKALGRTGVRPEKRPPAESRLVWLVRYRPGERTVALLPRIQRRGAGGGWKKGQPVSLKRLRQGRYYLLSEQDRSICAALNGEAGADGDRSPRVAPERVLPLLVGHHAMFLEENPLMPVEFFRGGPEIAVKEAGGNLLVTMQPFPLKKGVVVEQVAPARFKVAGIEDDHLRVAGIIGAEGLCLPSSARDELTAILENLSRFLVVHAEDAGRSTVLGVAAPATIYLHVSPYGRGLRITMLVKPFGPEGPSLQPGMGARNLMAEIHGERRHVVRDLEAEELRAREVEERCPLLAGLDHSGREWLLEEIEDCLELLANFQTLPAGVIVLWPEGRKMAVSPPVSPQQLHLQLRRNRGWFELSGGLKVDDALVLDMAGLLAMSRDSGSRFLPLSDGQYLALTSELRKQLQDIDACVQTKKDRLCIHPLAALPFAGIEQSGAVLDADRYWRERLNELQEIDGWSPEIPATLRAELRDYQAEGYRWLARLARLGMGACLADDMGLGKTVQALALLLSRAAAGPALVVAPTSVCENWRREAARFAPTLRVILFAETTRRGILKKLGPFDVLLVSYNLMQIEAEALGGMTWSTLVLDEAQAIKNIMTKRARAAMKLAGRFRLVTTGTPIENHLGELWSLFQFINPGLLGSLDHFNQRFAVPIERFQDQGALRRLKKIIQPFILRRIKAQVLEELPPRTEISLQVAMGEREAAFYEALRRQALQRLQRVSGVPGRRNLHILAEITRMRQACCNARLVLPDSTVPSAKLALFGKLLDELLENRHQVLVFSQFVGYLAILRQFLDEKVIRYCYLDGSTPRRLRQEQVDQFQAGKADVFLISLKAGGLGLNLTAADYVIHMDPWWNPAVENQASDRVHRIGQTRPVTVYRLVTSHTIEERIVRLHQEKRELAEVLLAGTDIGARLTAEELLDLLREE